MPGWVTAAVAERCNLRSLARPQVTYCTFSIRPVANQWPAPGEYPSRERRQRREIVYQQGKRNLLCATTVDAEHILNAAVPAGHRRGQFAVVAEPDYGVVGPPGGGLVGAAGGVAGVVGVVCVAGVGVAVGTPQNLTHWRPVSEARIFTI